MENLTEGQILLLFAAVLHRLAQGKARLQSACNWDPTNVRNKLSYFSMNQQFKGNVAFCYWIPDICHSRENSKNLGTYVLIMALDVNAIIYKHEAAENPAAFFWCALKTFCEPTKSFCPILFQSYWKLVLTIIPSVFLQCLVPSVDSSVLFLLIHYSRCHCTPPPFSPISQFQFPYCYTFNRKRWRLLLCLGFLCCFDFCTAVCWLTVFKELSLQ